MKQRSNTREIPRTPDNFRSAEYYRDLGYGSSESETETGSASEAEPVSCEEIVLNHASKEIPPPPPNPPTPPPPDPPTVNAAVKTINKWWQSAKKSFYGLFATAQHNDATLTTVEATGSGGTPDQVDVEHSSTETGSGRALSGRNPVSAELCSDGTPPSAAPDQVEGEQSFPETGVAPVEAKPKRVYRFGGNTRRRRADSAKK